MSRLERACVVAVCIPACYVGWQLPAWVGLSTNKPAIVNQGGGKVCKSTPTITQSQLDQAVSILDRHGNTTEANKAKIMKLETRLKQLEQRMNATLPDPLREVQK